MKVQNANPNDITPNPVNKTGNQTLVIDEIATNPAEFHPCRYDIIRITTSKEIAAASSFDTRDIVIYDSSDKSKTIYQEPIEVTAGFKENLGSHVKVRE